MSAHHDDFARDWRPGLPEALPAGERLLWQGAPEWKALARRALHVDWVVVYFAALAAWHVLSSLQAGQGPVVALQGALPTLVLGGMAVVMLLGVARWMAVSTIYSITSARAVLRIGAALPMTLNIPFRLVQAVDVQRYADGTADIALTLDGKDRAAYLVLWPHARPWRLANPAPMLRVVAGGAQVAELLADALGGRLAPASASGMGRTHGSPPQGAAAD